MPIVFVHGVNVRQSPQYDKEVSARKALFKQYALRQLPLNPDTVAMFNPYWGGDAAKLAWSGASLPSGADEAFGAGDALAETFIGESLGAKAVDNPPDDDTVALTIARSSLVDAVDLLVALAIDSGDPEQIEETVALSVKALQYAQQQPNPPAWLQEVENDEEFFARLRLEVKQWQPPAALPGGPAAPAVEAFGLLDEAWDSINEGLGRVGDVAGNWGSGAILTLARKPLNTAVAHFLGDIFVYLKHRGDRNQPGEIVKKIVADLKAASAAVKPADPYLIVIAHSMGGNIVYDILTHFQPDLKVDLLVTVGSQVALFEELKLYHSSDQAIPIDPRQERVKQPTNLRRWINVYDPNDILSFAAAGVFDGPKDYDYSTGKGLISAHTTYFQRVSFHKRLSERLTGVFQ